MLHIGKRIKEVFDIQPKSHNIEWFAACLNCKRANVYNIFSRANLDTELLAKISIALNHDFFADISAEIAPQLTNSSIYPPDPLSSPSSPSAHTSHSSRKE